MSIRFLNLTFTLFLLMDALGNIPVFLTLLKNISPARRRYIIIREMLIALAAMVIFALFGNQFLTLLGVTEASVYLAGGVILFLIGIRMIFPGDVPLDKSFSVDGEPFIIPLAIPMVAGPAVLAAIMIYSKSSVPLLPLLAAIFIAWCISCLLFLLSTKLYHVLGDKGLKALENLMGLILLLLAIQMFLNGIDRYLGCLDTGICQLLYLN